MIEGEKLDSYMPITQKLIF